MNYQDWKEKYKPVINHMRNTPLYDGFLWGTTDGEMERINAGSVSHIWSLLEENQVIWISPGIYNYPKTKGYFVTDIGWTVSEKELVVNLMEPMDIFVAHLGSSIGWENLIDLRIRIDDAMADSGLLLK